MATSRSPNEVAVQIGTQVQAGWTRYDIDSSLLVAADAWSVTLATSELTVPPGVVPGAAVKVTVGGETVLAGTLDEVDHAVDKQGHTLSLSGRDGAGVLLDCSAPVFTRGVMTLEEVIAKVVRPLGVINFRVDAEKKLTRDRVSTEPGDSAWDMLRRAAEANGLWPWFEPDGTLVVGGPDYSKPTVANLALKADGSGNLLALSEHRSIVERYSRVTVLGQAHAVGTQAGRHNVQGVAEDTGVKANRPKIVTDHEATTSAIATARANKIISDARVRGYELRATVKGHRTEGGVLWAAGQRVNVESEPHGLNGVYFVMSRRFTGDRARGPGHGAEPARRRRVGALRAPEPAQAPPRQERAAGGDRRRLEGGCAMSELVNLIRREIGRAGSAARGALRGLLSATNRGPQVQLVDGEGLAGEQLKAVELFQHFGFSSAPPAGTQIIVLPLGGRTSAGVVVASEHGSYRFHLGADGEAAVYNQWGDVVHLRSDRTIHVVAQAKVLIDTADVTINASTSMTINAPTFTVNAGTGVALNTPTVAASAQLTTGGNISGGADVSAVGEIADAGGSKSMSGMRGTFNAHKHPENNDPVNITNTPDVSM